MLTEDLLDSRVEAAVTLIRAKTDAYIRDRLLKGRTSDEAAADYLNHFVGMKNESRFHREQSPVLAAVLRVRHRAVGKFAPEFSGQRFEDYDRAVLDVYAEIENTFFEKA